MTYQVVKIEPCERPQVFVSIHGGCEWTNPCIGCRGDGTRMVDVCEVEPDDWSDVGIPKPVWLEVDQ